METRLDIGADDFAARAFDHYAALRAACPVHRAVLTDSAHGNQGAAFHDRPIWAVTGYDAAVAALVDSRFSIDPHTGLSAADLAQIPGFDDPEVQVLFRNLLSLDPPDHTRLRRLVQPSFTGRAVAAWAPRIDRIARDLLDAAEAAAAARGETCPERTMELVSAFAFPLPIAVIFEVLGVPPSDRERVHAWTDALLGRAGEPGGFAAAARQFVDFGRELVAAKRATPADDLLTRLAHTAQDGDRLDDDELVSLIFLLVLAGHVTTVNLITNAICALLSHPAELAELRADPGLVGGAVEETLRCFGPVELAGERYPTEDLVLDRVPVRRGDLVLPVLGAADRDAARFADPDRFDISRPDAHQHLAFGKGVHACLGAPLARLEGRIALGALLGRYPDLRLDADPADLGWQALPLRGVSRLPLRF